MPLDPNTWTHKTTEAVNAALGAAKERSNPEATSAHLLAALLRQEDGVVLPVVRKLGLNPLTVRDEPVVEPFLLCDGGVQLIPHVGAAARRSKPGDPQGGAVAVGEC